MDAASQSACLGHAVYPWVVLLVGEKLAGKVTGNINARARCDLRAPGIVVGNITSPVVTMEEGVRFDGQMCMSTALDSAVRAGTLRAPAAEEDPGEATLGRRGSRRSAPAVPDPSDLLKPVP